MKIGGRKSDSLVGMLIDMDGSAFLTITLFFSASMLRESYDYSDCRISFMHQQRVAALRNKLLNLRDKVAKAPDENRKFMAGQEVRKVVLELIESEGYDSLEAFVDEEMKTTPLMHEASRKYSCIKQCLRHLSRICVVLKIIISSLF